MSKVGSDYSLAHELGHALGALDCYAKTEESASVTRWFELILPRKDYFSSSVRDWGDAEGRGFYEKKDMYSTILKRCLMNGYDGSNQADIPDGSILSLRNKAKRSADRWQSPIGASTFESKTNAEVYSR